jgi:hypothetical protein
MFTIMTTRKPWLVNARCSLNGYVQLAQRFCFAAALQTKHRTCTLTSQDAAAGVEGRQAQHLVLLDPGHACLWEGHRTQVTV